jgi:hypothetical protein
MNPTGKPMVAWRAVATRYPCDVCGAQPGEPCKTYAGRRKYEVHHPRSELASANGWRDPDEGLDTWDGHL